MFDPAQPMSPDTNSPRLPYIPIHHPFYHQQQQQSGRDPEASAASRLDPRQPMSGDIEVVRVLVPERMVICKLGGHRFVIRPGHVTRLRPRARPGRLRREGKAVSVEIA